MVRGSWRPNITATYWPPPTLMAVSVVSFSFSRAAGWWLSLLHLISNFSGPQLIRGPQGPLRPGVAFPTTSRLLLQLPDILSWPSYIIVQRPLNRQLNLWNGMFDRHQAEITVMQFTGHSLPVHQSMSVSWDFLPCPISSAKHAYAISSHNCHRNVSLPSGASLRNGKFGRIEGQNTTQCQKQFYFEQFSLAQVPSLNFRAVTSQFWQSLVLFDP